jgi:hypothetical protein
MASVEKMSRNTAESINDAGMGINLRKKFVHACAAQRPGYTGLTKWIC